MTPVTTFLQRGDRVLFQGDSITDWGRDRDDPMSLGHGWVAIAAALAGARRPELGLEFLNRGVGGDTAAMVRDRWERDALELRPTVISLLVGINDTWRRYDAGTATSTDEYEEHYRALLDPARERLAARFVLVEPFLLPLTPDQPAWREDLDPRIAVVRRLATEYDALLLRADDLFAEAAEAAGAEHWTFDGVHLSVAGNGLLAEAWLDAVGIPA
ncbi:SGNH/GDSL hydrolase family protein [Cellulomonas sp. DKR-3]|uniref:SGNH/GDSL hydrolase family protein n=1 Tax=Cellulomonas fulva TaxID=2835530 RepID=A0ABS5U2N1_9CELL|nr:SGNH/GDSL hydrolase family protein [Cellulomonas fulva]MBT0995656.1 SGNH/GDSL hydrolase family protein [Cellulomonas fulva]